ncbi:MAG: VanW family protein [Lachnospiraceae bacterium]|nr:VanW family protein [Lachnospiraceae bacterium]
MKKIKRRLTAVIATVMLIAAALPTAVFADSVTSVVMTYQDKTYTKQFYGTEVESIKSGANTEGLSDIGGLIDSLTFLLNGEVQFDKAAVTSAVKNAIIAGQTGISIDLSKYVKGASSAQSAPSETVTVVPSIPAVTENQQETPADNSQLTDRMFVLSEASTKFRANEDRAKNIRNAASKINGMVILPGQMFSCTTAFGPRLVSNGYGLGNVISGDTYVKGVGGGICQVSSTLNLAVLRAGIVPTERHNHSHRSSYIASGLDATISGSSLDYKFVNPYNEPIMISAVTNGGVISISILSAENVLKGVVYEPVVSGGKMSNTTHVVGKLAGMQISDRVAYSSRYKQ